MKQILVLIAISLFSSWQIACKDNNTEPGNDPDQFSNQVILDWNLVAFEVMGGATPAYQHTHLASRINAMTHIAMHDALNAITPRYQTYAFHQKNSDAHPVVAAATAAYEVLVDQAPARKPMLDSCLAVSLTGIADGTAKMQGIELGKQAAAAILALRKNDGAFQDPISVPADTDLPGAYRVVPPFNFVFAPFWKTMQTFSLQQADQFRITPQPALTSQEYTDGFNEVKRIGQKNSPHRSAEQSTIAKFWYEFSEIGWNRVTRAAVADKKPGLLATARLFALVNMALADAYTAGWDSKFHYDFWRPYTAIRAAETDGNPNTEADPQWEPAEVTPPVQDYPSTHSALGNAAATVLTAILGENTGFSMTSTTAPAPGTARSFYTFLQAADENAESRVLAGIHFRFSCEKGQSLGNQIGKWTVDHHLKPVE
jgi:hypothetical protein